MSESKLAGRKKIAQEAPFRYYLPIPYYTSFSYQPFFEKGSKTKITDENGKVVYDAKKESRIHKLCFIPEDDLEKAKQDLENIGYKKIKFHSAPIDLPPLCPSCERIGSPTYSKENRFEMKRKPIRIIYNHSQKEPPKTCLYAEIDFKNKKLRLKKGLSIQKAGWSHWAKFFNFDNNL